MIVKIIITIVALCIAAVRIIVPNLTIDATMLILLGIAALPWFIGIIESVELPGGVKINLSKLEKIGQRAETVGLASDFLSKSEEQQYSFQVVGLEDPNLALAGLRIEIERRLKQLAEKHDIGTRMQGIGSLVNTLSNRDLLGQEERSVILDMISLLNGAVHGAITDRRAATWAMDFGPRLLKALDERIGA